VIPRSCCPGEWFGAGKAVLAPLYRKRIILLERAKWVHVWTLYNEKLSTRDWLTPPEATAALHFPVEIKSRDPSGWFVTIPPHLRNTGWLPGGGGIVMFDYCASEANFWTESAYNEESVLEADAT
jgi:hypothetical protein